MRDNLTPTYWVPPAYHPGQVWWAAKGSRAQEGVWSSVEIPSPTKPMASMAAFAFLVFYLARLPLLIEFCRYGWGLEVGGEVRDPSKLAPEGSELRA